MRKATTTNKGLILFTLLFIIIAACSFAAFQKTEAACQAASQCTQTAPPANRGEMIWDLFSRRLISLISLK